MAGIMWPRTSGKVPLSMIQDRRFLRDYVTDDFKRLVESVRRHGVIVPIVVNDTYEVVDGMDRLMAAKSLGHKEIPAIATKDYVTIITHMMHTREFAQQHDLPQTPYQPRHLAEHINMLSEMHRSTYRARGRAVPTTLDRASFNKDITDAFGLPISHMVCTRTIFGAEASLGDRSDPEAVAIREFIAKWEAEWPDGLTPSSAKTRMYTLARRAKMGLDSPPREKSSLPSTFNAKETARQRSAFANTLTLVSGGLDGLAVVDELSPRLTTEDLVDWEKQILTMMSRIRHIRGLIRKGIATRNAPSTTEESAP